MSETLNTSLSTGIALSPTSTYQSPFTIDVDGTIDTGGVYGVASTDLATLINDGAITASVYGVSFIAGGYVSNSSAATIESAYTGVVVQGATGTVINTGGITGGTGQNSQYPNDGIYLGDGGIVTNAGTASQITGQAAGVRINYYNGTPRVQNQGTITGTGTYGVFLPGGGYVTNSTSATIVGLVGLQVNNYGTVLNAGTIEGTSVSGSSFFNIYGLRLSAGTITNSAGGVIESVYQAINLGNGSIYNAGTITGSTALELGGQVTVSNAASGVIEGAIGGFGTLTLPPPPMSPASGSN
jgi:hypothetical protein